MGEITFRLDDGFVETFVDRVPDWGPIGYVTYKRTYAREIADLPDRYLDLAQKQGLVGTEEWWLTITRVVEGTYRIQERHCKRSGLHWDDAMAQESAQEMFKLIFDMKFLPPGRGLWMMGTDYVMEKGGAALNNCAFVTTENLAEDFSGPFCFLMDMSMLGVGVGGDCRGAGEVMITSPKLGPPEVVEDSREGWVALIRRLLDSFTGKNTFPCWVDVTKVREKGSKIRGFGGTASGAEPLLECFDAIHTLLASRVGDFIMSSDIVDIFNLIGRCVVAGNVRRSAEIMFGECDDADFLSLKDFDKWPEQVKNHRWASNNSIFADVGQDYSSVAALTAKNGEPGYFWLENARDYGRMIDPANYADRDAMGGNPCLEQTLWPYELCCLVETFPSRHLTYAEFQRTLKFAYLYAKTVTLLATHDHRTNAVMLQNRRIGTSMTGIVQAINRHGLREMLDWCDEGYEYIRRLDVIYSNWLAIPRSIKVTSVKPSGTVSLLPGVTPGIHFPHSEFYMRVIRFPDDSPMLEKLKDAGYRCYDLNPNEPNTVAVYFPVREKHFVKSKTDVSMWEQLMLAAAWQRYWADNQVSATVTFRPDEADQIADALAYFEDQLKGVSFLPIREHGYSHAPYQEIDEDEYNRAKACITPVTSFNGSARNEVIDRFCDGESCSI